MTYALARKPAFAAMQRAPAEHLRPAVSAPPVVPRALLRLPPGLSVAVTPRAAGPIVVALRRGAATLATARLSGASGRRVTAHLRSPVAAPGRYVVSVRAARAATVRRAVRIR
jgi:hypothetical protein